jgi:hypothetical protein
MPSPRALHDHTIVSFDGFGEHRIVTPSQLLSGVLADLAPRRS